MANRSRGWCFTMYDCTAARHTLLANLDCVYIIYQEEVAPGTGRVHVQGYIYWKNAKNLEQARGVLPFGCHLEKANGTPAENKIYCSKIDSRKPNGIFLERGIMPIQGKRADYQGMMKDIKNGLSDLEMFEKHTVHWHQYGRSLKRYRSLLPKPRKDVPIIKVYYGPTGTGKSHEAISCATRDCGNSFEYACHCERGKQQWFDKCAGKMGIIFEDFDGGCPYRLLLQVIDKYPIRVQSKGDSFRITATRFYFTSNQHPRYWYPKETVYEGSPLWRRLETRGSEIISKEEVYESDSDSDT